MKRSERPSCGCCSLDTGCVRLPAPWACRATPFAGCGEKGVPRFRRSCAWSSSGLIANGSKPS
jgi:hypothetical protein